MEIIARNLSKFFGRNLALNVANIKISSGQITAIIGPNAAGKSTLLKILALLLKPDSGEIIFNGKNISAFTPARKLALRRQMVYLPQHPVIFSGSVRDNLAYGLKIRHSQNIREKVEQALRNFSLPMISERNARQISGGEKHRLMLARALVLETEVVFFDEPTTNLDPLGIKITEEIIENLRQQQRTIVLTTHNLILARHFADYIYFLDRGEIVQQGSAEDIFQHPGNCRIAEFTGSPNILTGEIIDAETFLTDGLKIFIARSEKRGPAAIIIRPEEILVSPEPIIHSSARNCLAGTVRQIKPIGLVRELKVQISPRNFLTVLITAESEQKMKLQIGTGVYLVFKATAIHLLEEMNETGQQIV